VSLVAWFSTISVAYRLAEAHRTGKAVDRAVGGGVVKHGSNPEGPFFFVNQHPRVLFPSWVARPGVALAGGSPPLPRQFPSGRV
jgi:hypothetical protein